jgi:hypothetical protein
VVLPLTLPRGEVDCRKVWGAFHEGLSRLKSGYFYGYIDRAGEAVIAAQFESASEFSEGLAAVMLLNGKWGYIDTKRRMVIGRPAE